MVKSVVKADEYMVTDLMNLIIVERVISAEWKLRTSSNCYRRKGDALERGNYREPKLADHILKIVERCHYHLEIVTVEILILITGFCFAFVDFEKAFDCVPRVVICLAGL